MYPMSTKVYVAIMIVFTFLALGFVLFILSI